MRPAPDIASETAAEPEPARVVLVDDHPVYRLGLKALIDECDDLKVVGEADNAEDALRLVGAGEVRGVIVDVMLRGQAGGLELVRVLRQRAPELAILVISMHDETVYAERAVGLGANGYTSKSDPPERFLAALRSVLRGEMFLSASVTQTLLKQRMLAPGYGPSGLASLSNRELEVFELLGRGMATRRVAESLHLSVKTVESHRARIRDKLGLADGSALVHAATVWVTSGATTAGWSAGRGEATTT